MIDPKLIKEKQGQKVKLEIITGYIETERKSSVIEVEGNIVDVCISCGFFKLDNKKIRFGQVNKIL